MATTIDLNAWHHAIHQVTGNMALRFNRATPADLERWAEMLRKVAEEMEACAQGSICAQVPNSQIKYWAGDIDRAIKSRRPITPVKA